MCYYQTSQIIFYLFKKNLKSFHSSLKISNYNIAIKTKQPDPLRRKERKILL